MTGCKIVFSGENSIEVQFEQKICIEVNRMVFEFAKLFVRQLNLVYSHYCLGMQQDRLFIVHIL